ncbi:MAG: hydroxymethylbilane synthase [Blastochloris sp.]|nr:hydroxymethylbilane synthase [Blastochloris sp.]
MSEFASVKIGTRGSPLALAQSSMIRQQLALAWPSHHFELITIKTTGDSLQETLVKPAESTKAIFTKEIEEALLEKKIDLAIHSAKDLAAHMPEGLHLASVPLRASPCDVLVLKPGISPLEAQQGLILSGSARRQRQWLDLHPQAQVEPVRGNIDTRLKKLLLHPRACGLLLAAAGLERLQPDLLGCSLHPLPPHEFIPAPGQGTLALQSRCDDPATSQLLLALHDPISAFTLTAERSFLTAMNAGCSVPLGAYAWLEKGQLHLEAIFYPSGNIPALRHRILGDTSQAELLGKKLAERFL